jgi:DNA-binding MarR family transcriptional regulator
MRALLLCRNSDIAIRRRVRAESGLGDTDILAVDFLHDQSNQDETVTPKQLASHLGLSSPSTTILIDRLEKVGSVERVPHPTDRRALVLKTAETDPVATLTRTATTRRIQHLIEGLSAEHASIVLRFLSDLADVAEPDAEEDSTRQAS